MDVASIAKITIFRSGQPPIELTQDEEQINRGANWFHDELRRTRENMTQFVSEAPLASELLGGQHSLGADYRGPSNEELDEQVRRLDAQRERAPEFSEEALALRFAARHASDLRYVAEWGKWFAWTGIYWRSDRTMHAFDLARQIAREAAAKCNRPNEAKMIASSKTVAAIERLAKADRRLAATIDQWDADP
jgi:hypothetical protein